MRISDWVQTCALPISAIASTAGNEDCHVILRRGKAPNYDAESVDAACDEAARAGQIGRASCRERVGQYVSTPGAAASYTKQTKAKSPSSPQKPRSTL